MLFFCPFHILGGESAHQSAVFKDSAILAHMALCTWRSMRLARVLAGQLVLPQKVLGVLMR